MPPIREIPGPMGRLEALVEEPVQKGVDRHGLAAIGHHTGLRAVVVFGHPHPQFGGTMHTKAVYQAAKAATRMGCVSVRFNFRGVGSSAGTWDEGKGEMDDFRAALDFAAARYPGVPMWAAGMSFGSWIALTVGAADPRVSQLIGIAPPLDRYDFEPVRLSDKPKFFIQGERDELCPTRLLREFYARCDEPKEMVIIEDADHLFDGRTPEVGDAFEDLLGD